MNIKGKFSAFTLSLGLIPLVLVMAIGYFVASSELEEQAFGRLEAIRDAKFHQIDDYLSLIEQQVISQSNNRMFREAMTAFKYAFDGYHFEYTFSDEEIAEKHKAIRSYYANDFANEYKIRNGQDVDIDRIFPEDSLSKELQASYIAQNPNPLGNKEKLDNTGDGSNYDEVHGRYHPSIRDFLQRFGYYDIFLVDVQTGNIVYSVFKELDFATSLKTGPYKDSGIAQAFNAALRLEDPNASVLIDFQPYGPSYDAPAAFTASPITENGKTIGILIFQMPIERINNALSVRSGMGETGEVYIVGKDKLMRTDSRFEQQSTILSKQVDTAATQAALTGETSAQIIDDYRGVSVLSAFKPLKHGNMDWALVAEIDEDEALASVRQLTWLLLVMLIVTGTVIIIAVSMFSRRFSQPVVHASEVADSISRGNLNNKIESGSGDETGDLLRSLSRMQEDLKLRVQSEDQAAQNERIRVALDNATTQIMVANNDREIIYMNKAADRLFTDIESDIRQDLPQFNASQLLGTSIDIFHKNPAHQASLLSTLNRTFDTEARIGGRIMRIVANPVIAEDGERLGTSVEWQDRTTEVAIEDELENIVAAARSGQMAQRVSIEGKDGFFKHLAVGINALLDDLCTVFNDMSKVMESMSAGDLTQPIGRQYQGIFGKLRDNVNDTLIHLSGTVVELRETADQVSSAANEISTGNTNLSSRTEQQAASLEETASTMEELTAQVRHNADNASEANQLASSARNKAEEGGNVVNQAIVAMDQIDKASRKIAEIIGMIDEIAFQTNLLALNASVEAARAGEQGRGFAVVATEVRNLASRSASAAKEIKELIVDSQDKVNAGAELVNESGQTLEEIVSGIKKLGDIIAEIAAGSSEQASGIEQVNMAINSIDETTQQNASLAEQTSAASASLNDRAQRMNQLMAFFNASSDIQARLEELEQSEQQVRTNANGSAAMDFFEARNAHLAWSQKISDFLEGKKSLTRKEAVSHRDCVLGKWLYSVGLEKYGHLSKMQELEPVHENLHLLIREIIDHKNAGDQESANLKFDEMKDVSKTIIALLKEVEHEVDNH